jgi:hypothetical protein
MVGANQGLMVVKEADFKAWYEFSSFISTLAFQLDLLWIYCRMFEKCGSLLISDSCYDQWFLSFPIKNTGVSA